MHLEPNLPPLSWQIQGEADQFFLKFFLLPLVRFFSVVWVCPEDPTDHRYADNEHSPMLRRGSQGRWKPQTIIVIRPIFNNTY